MDNQSGRSHRRVNIRINASREKIGRYKTKYSGTTIKTFIIFLHLV